MVSWSQTFLSGRVPGTRCQSSAGAQAPVAPVLPPPLSNKIVVYDDQNSLNGLNDSAAKHHNMIVILLMIIVVFHEYQYTFAKAKDISYSTQKYLNNKAFSKQ